MEEIAAVGAAAVLWGVAAMQVALALGAPWGAHAYGGRVAAPGEALPAAYRLASLLAVGLLLVAGWLVLARADLMAAGALSEQVVHRGAWVVAGFLALNTVANLASTSHIERWVLGTATAIAALLTVVVAQS